MTAFDRMVAPGRPFLRSPSDHATPASAFRGNDELRAAPKRAESSAAGRPGVAPSTHEEVRHVGADPGQGKEASVTAHLTPCGSAGASPGTSTVNSIEPAYQPGQPGGLDEQETDYMPDTDLECPACDGMPPGPPNPCLVCGNTGRIAMFGDEHALDRAGGPQVWIEDEMVAIRVPSYANHGAIGIDLPLATFRWLMQHGSLALALSDEDTRTRAPHIARAREILAKNATGDATALATAFALRDRLAVRRQDGA